MSQFIFLSFHWSQVMILIFRAKNKGFFRRNVVFSDIQKSVRNEGIVIRRIVECWNSRVINPFIPLPKIHRNFSTKLFICFRYETNLYDKTWIILDDQEFSLLLNLSLTCHKSEKGRKFNDMRVFFSDNLALDVLTLENKSFDFKYYF